jgi:hypothetical protein
MTWKDLELAWSDAPGRHGQTGRGGTVGDDRSAPLTGDTLEDCGRMPLENGPGVSRRQ